MTDEYKEFVEKFKPKLTTDDCYTPPAVYDAVKNWAIKEYGWENKKIVRPFYPGGDYENYTYTADCVVIDNPPFSIFSKIVDFYNERGIDYFLFAPANTLFSSPAVSLVCVGVTVTYDNGAKVNTSFVSSQGDKIRSAPSLYAALYEADMKNRAEKKKHVPKYLYPAPVVTASILNLMSKYGVEYSENKCERVRALDQQRPLKKTIYGQGFFVPAAKAAAAKAAAKKAKEMVVWELSEREKAIVAGLETGEK